MSETPNPARVMQACTKPFVLFYRGDDVFVLNYSNLRRTNTASPKPQSSIEPSLGTTVIMLGLNNRKGDLHHLNKSIKLQY